MLMGGALREGLRLVKFFLNCSRRRFTPGVAAHAKNAPSLSARSSSTSQLAKISPRSCCADQGRKSSASTRSRWKNAAIASRSFAMSPSRRALITMHPGCFAQRRFAFLRASSPTRSILLKTRMRGTSFAPISSSTSSVTASCRSNPGSLASTTWASSDASSASSSVDLNEATSPCGRFLMKPTVSLTSTRGTVSGCRARTVVSSVAKSLFGDQHLAPRERAHQGGLARVRVADERHAREPLALLPPRALRLALEVHRVELLLQLGDAVADLAPVELAVRLAGAAAADAAALPALRARQLGGFAQARRHVAEARDLDLRARGARARVAVEDLEDDHGAVHHLAADLLLEVARLRGGDLVVDEDQRRRPALPAARCSSSRLPVPKYAAVSNPARFCVNLPTTSKPSVFASWRSSVSEASNSGSLTLGSCTAATMARFANAGPKGCARVRCRRGR